MPEEVKQDGLSVTLSQTELKVLTAALRAVGKNNPLGEFARDLHDKLDGRILEDLNNAGGQG